MDSEEKSPLLTSPTYRTFAKKSHDAYDDFSSTARIGDPPLNIVHLASECVPFVWGGLGHAISGIATAQAKAGHNVVVLVPYSRRIQTNEQGLHVIADFDVLLPQQKKYHCVVFESKISSSTTTTANVSEAEENVPSVFFIHHPLLNGKDIYAYQETADSAHHVTILAAFEFLKTKLFPISTKEHFDCSDKGLDILHFHDWVCGFGPLLMRKDPFFNRSVSIFTIHNGAYQGFIGIEEGMSNGFDSCIFHEPITLEGQISMLRLGIIFADKVTTVSSTYRLELMRSEHGMGNDDMLRKRSKEGDFIGIVNGIDTNEWNPQNDGFLFAPFDVRTVQEGKMKNKIFFQKKFQLFEDVTCPLLVICSRITRQKGIHLLLENLRQWLQSNKLQLVVIGNKSDTDTFGAEILAKLWQLVKEYPNQVAIFPYDTKLEHCAIAAADMFFMGSLFEPCGLAHQHAGRYGAVTIGTAVGGICDTTVNYFSDPHLANAFLATTPDASSIAFAFTTALGIFATDHQRWNNLVVNAMNREASWETASCPQYIKVYREAKRFRQTFGQEFARATSLNSNQTIMDYCDPWDPTSTNKNMEALESQQENLTSCHRGMNQCCCENKWITFDVELFYQLPSIFHASKTTPARNDFLYVIFKTSLINLAVRAYLIMVSVDDGDLGMTYGILSLVWYQLQDCVFTIFGQTYMKFLGKIGPLVRIYDADFGDLCFVLVMLFILEFSNRLILGPLNGNYAAYSWEGILTIMYNLIQGIVSSGPVDPTINKLRMRGIISHTTAMHIFQVMGLSLLFGLLATFGYQTLHAIVMATQFTIFGSIYICLIIFKNPAARLRNASRAIGDAVCCRREGTIDGINDNKTPNSINEIDLTIDLETRKRYPSPANWNDEIIYSIMVDRFNLGRSDNLVPPSGVQLDGNSRHGGDIIGIKHQLNYLQELGVTSLLISPILTNSEFVLEGVESYHGYSPVHLLEVDPRLGTLKDFKELVSACHNRGMRVILDFPLNHVACVFEYANNDSSWIDLEQPPKEINWKQELRPIELKQEEHFTRHGVIDDWKNQQQSMYGDFPPNFRKLATNRKETQDLLLNVLQYWMKETDIDGFRIDAAKHLDKHFLERIDDEIRGYAGMLGKTNFFLLLEHSSGVEQDILPLLLMSGGEHSFYAYNYPDFRRATLALHGEAATRHLEVAFLQNTMNFEASYDDKNNTQKVSTLHNLVRFLDNHDVFRFLRSSDDESVLFVSLGYLLFSIGLPMLYYGTEQLIRQDYVSLEPESAMNPADPDNRANLFQPRPFDPMSSLDAPRCFDNTIPSYLFIKQLIDIRKKHQALSRGDQVVRWSDPTGPGLFVFSRIFEGKEIIVALNTATTPKSATVALVNATYPVGTEFEDILDCAYIVSIVSLVSPPSGVGLRLTVPARSKNGLRVLVMREMEEY